MAGGSPLVPAWHPAALQVFTRHAGRYGTRGLRTEIQTESHRVNRLALSRPLGQPAPTAPNHVWVGDITYLPLVLTGHLARRLHPVVGWHLGVDALRTRAYGP
ncbi:hypothetical protein MUN84_18735 [Hymenobacter sp. 5516J-16]|uniref:hypothetical protein n=1 Tax=Hymenobacter sp. 5516J-16 TaxID=2932253 RepID=UPI001FD4F2F2|nr:hypothetical protein [Hymenobacter sp. 5516J-16]UOQ76551.1 hypothetical protein MUN84_18735 [Hymenobacter sp. 5516J-16]